MTIQVTYEDSQWQASIEAQTCLKARGLSPSRAVFELARKMKDRELDTDYSFMYPIQQEAQNEEPKRAINGSGKPIVSGKSPRVLRAAH